MEEIIIRCPIEDFSCPYYKDDPDGGFCKMWQMEQCNPIEECDAFLWDDEDWEG